MRSKGAKSTFKPEFGWRPFLNYFLFGLLFVIEQAQAFDDAIVFIGSREDEYRKNVGPACLEKALKQIRPDQKIVESAKFTTALFPFFETNTIPHEAGAMSELLANPLVHEKIVALGVRFVVTAIQQSTKIGEGGGFMGCGVGYEYGGCLGVATQEKTTDMSLVLWDFEHPEQSIESTATAQGKDVWIGFGLPIPFLANTKSNVCKLLAAKISSFLNGDTALEASPLEE